MSLRGGRRPTWQSRGSGVYPRFPARCCQEIATAPLGPRNDRCGRWSAPGLQFSHVIARSEATRQSVFLQAVIFPDALRSPPACVLVTALRGRSACTGYGLPRLLRSLAMTSKNGCHCRFASPLAMTGLGADDASGGAARAVRGPFVGLCGDLTVFPGEIGHFFVLTIPCAYYIVNKISIGKRLFQSKIYDRRRLPAKAIRTAGSNAENRRGGGWQLLLPY